ncbi:putative MFS family arabinose efflux permease [Prauserella shujinwangii]|uniref:Putative MFS family arabinose efflux permease n=1 Tax=Prauserella shujinwangii TaxID=1453103 RepID=A0A2T0LZ39_9PSEU|nr:MFS transporter [Prauserella shujinwangii]PRX49374.1 putative MFS family arabinose efflux permease [Prauserella shujinwangii]
MLTSHPTGLVRAAALPSGRIRSVAGTVGVLVAAVLLAVSHIYVTIPLVPAVAGEYATTVAAAGWIGSGFGFAFAVGNLVFPTVSDFVDPRRVMALGLLAVAGTGVVAGLAPNLTILIAARAVQGFVAPAVPPVALAYLPRVVPDRFRAMALAVLSSCFLLSGILGQAWSLSIGAAFGWRWSLGGLVPLLVVVAALVMMLPAASRPAAPGSFRTVLGTLAGMLRKPQMLAAYTGAVAFLLTFVGMYVALQASSAELGAADPVTGLLLRLPGLPGIVVGLFGGLFIGRWGPHRTGAGAFLVAAAGLGIEAAGGPLWLVLTGSAVFVAGLAVAVPAAVTLVGIASGPARGAGMAGYAFLVGAGASLGPLLAGALTGAGFAVTCGVLAVILLVPAAAFGASRRASA